MFTHTDRVIVEHILERLHKIMMTLVDVNAKLDVLDGAISDVSTEIGKVGDEIKSHIEELKSKIDAGSAPQDLTDLVNRLDASAGKISGLKTQIDQLDVPEAMPPDTVPGAPTENPVPVALPQDAIPPENPVAPTTTEPST